MGSVVELRCPPEREAQAFARLRELERRWSRFRADSDISRLNSAQGNPVRVHRDTVTLLRQLARAQQATNGAFDPTMLRPLVDLGYSTSRCHDEHRAPTPMPISRPVQSLTGVMIGPDEGADHQLVAIPRGLLVDPGGLGKGLAADLVADELMQAGAAGVMVNVGGDLRVAGVGEHGPGWRIAIETPDGSASLGSVVLLDGGVATSSTRTRTWRAGGRDLHHLLDPATQQPSTNRVVGCTVISSSAVWSEAFTKVAFVRPSDEAMAVYESQGLAALLVTETGQELRSSTWKVFDR
jgi:thiamine biosynthesis lipoprotein